MSDKDLEAKINCLSEAFKHERSVIIEVLKKNNYSLDSAAMELSEIPLPQPPKPKQQPVPQYQPQPQQQQPPVQRPPVVKQHKQDDDEDVMFTEVTKQLGDVGVTQSMFIDVHKQSGKDVNQTIRTLKNLYYQPTEEHKKMEEMQMQMEAEKKKAEDEQKKKMLHQQQLLQQQQQQQQQIIQQQQALQAEKLKKEAVEAERAKKLIEEKKATEERLKQMEIDKQRLERAIREKEEADRRDREAERENIQKQRALLLEQEKKLEAAAKQKTEALAAELAKQQKLIADQQLQKSQEEMKRKQEVEFTKAQLDNLLKQQEELKANSQIRDAEHQKFIEYQKSLIVQCQMQIDILKQKEFQAQQENINIAKKSQAEIESLKKLLVEEEEKNKADCLRRENEELMRQQIQDLEAQKELQRLQILELEAIEKKKIAELERELQLKQQELLQTKKSNFITLSVEQDAVTKDTVNIEWNLESKFDSGAAYWIGLYPTHQPKFERYLAYQKIQGSHGTISFPQVIPGHYEARLFRDKYTLLQVSGSVMIGPKVTLGVHVIGDQISVTFNVESADASYPYSYDWLGIYPQGSRNKKYLQSIYANNTGSVTFASPRVPGIYEIRYFVSPTKYNEQVKSTFELIDNDSVVISTPVAQPNDPFKVEYTINTIQPSTSDWVGIFAIDEENNKNYISSKYTNGTGHGELTLNAPQKPGDYEVRFFSAQKGKYITHKVSNRFIVTSSN